MAKFAQYYLKYDLSHLFADNYRSSRQQLFGTPLRDVQATDTVIGVSGYEWYSYMVHNRYHRRCDRCRTWHPPQETPRHQGWADSAQSQEIQGRLGERWELRKFLKTGDRNYLWNENYRRWDDHDYEETDHSDDFDAEDKECDRVLKEVKEFLDKDKPELILPDSYIMEQQQHRARRRRPKPWCWPSLSRFIVGMRYGAIWMRYTLGKLFFRILFKS